MINHNKRNKRYWKEVRNHLISHSLDKDTLLQLALDDDWLFEAMNYAPAGEHIAPAECAAIIIRNFLLSAD